MLKGLFSSKQEQAFSLSFGKIFYTKHNNLSCSKITLKSGNTKSYEILKTHTHPHIIPILKLSQYSVYTNRIVPFSQAFEKDKIEYNKYVVLKLKEAVNFVHSILKKEHRAINMESLALEESGKVILCNFEKTKDFDNSEVDDRMMRELSIFLTDFDVFADHEKFKIDEEIFDIIFKLNLSANKMEEKMNFFDKFIRNRNKLPEISAKFVFNSFLKDAEKDTSKEYKAKVFDFLFAFDEKYFNANIKTFFSILDSNLRVYLLQKFMEKNFTQQELDAITADLSLGLSVKDKQIRKATVDFVFQHDFGTDAMGFLLETMVASNDSETMLLICNYLLNFNKEGYYKQIYKLLLAFLETDKNPLIVYKCIEKYFSHFDKIKIAKEILPNLCSKLIEKDTQEYCFALVEKILIFLKGHKDDINNKDWTLKSITGIFTKKTPQPNKFEERVSKFSKEELDEWNDIEIE